jgi:hypothetical protein
VKVYFFTFFSSASLTPIIPLAAFTYENRLFFSGRVDAVD